MSMVRIFKPLLLGVIVVGLPLSQAQAAPIFTVAATGTAAGVNNFPAAEPPSAAIDSNATTKYLNFAKLNTGYLVTHAAGGIVKGITFTTANDAPERDPLTFSLYGSNSSTVTGTETAGTNIDLAGYTPITLAQVVPGLIIDPGRFTVASVPVVNTINYKSYLLFFPTVRDPVAANSMQIADAILTGAAGNITSSTDPIVGGVFNVPEPATLGLLGLGALGMLGRRRKA